MSRIKLKVRIYWARDTWSRSKGATLKLRLKDLFWSVVVDELRAISYNTRELSGELLRSKRQPADLAIRTYKYPELERNN
jgi:hypothetical protein